MLEMRHVTKIFNPGTVDEKIALNDLSFTLNDGDFVTVIGGNGAGKSTMQNAICGTWLPDAGEILLDGIDLSSLSEHQRAKYLGRVYQDPMTGTAAGMQIEENLALAARRGLRRTLRPGIRKSEREEYRQRLQELGLGLDTRLSAKVGTLSGGQRQALTLLMATLRKPKLLLLDEHTAALDPKTAAKVMEADGADGDGGEALHPDDHPQYAGRHPLRKPPYHAPRRAHHSGYLRSGEEGSHRAGAAGDVRPCQRRRVLRRPGHSGVKPLSSPSTSSGTAGRLPSFITQQGPAETGGALLGQRVEKVFSTR